MPSPPFDTSWDFRAALHLIDSCDDVDVDATPSTSLLDASPTHTDDVGHEGFKESTLGDTGGFSLGNFDKIWRALGRTGELPLPAVDEEPISSDDAGCFSAPDDNERSCDEATYQRQEGVDAGAADAPSACAEVYDSERGGAGASKKKSSKKKRKRSRKEKKAHVTGDLKDIVDKGVDLPAESSAAPVGHASEPAPVAITSLCTSKNPISLHLAPVALSADPASAPDIRRPSIQGILLEQPFKSIRELSQSSECAFSDPHLFSSQVKALAGSRTTSTSTPLSVHHGIYGYPHVSPSRHHIPQSTESFLGYLIPTQVAQAPYTSTSYRTGHPHGAHGGLNLAPNYVGTNPRVQYTTFGTLVKPTYNQSLPPVTLPAGSIPVFDSMTATHLGPEFSALHSVIPTSMNVGKALPRSREELHFDFLVKLIHRFPEEKKWLVSPFRQLKEKDMSPEGIHVFIDKSNITIGFSEMLKMTGRPPCNMSFECLCLLLERRRPVAKRVLAGSEHGLRPHRTDVKFNSQAGELGYEQNIFARVHKIREPTQRTMYWSRKGELQYSGGAFSGGSDSETGAPAGAAAVTRSSFASSTAYHSAPKWVEQGVDENLHLKMCNSLLDASAPSTMVLATGDGNEAEFSDGFLAHVERALRKGWRVELVGWRRSIHAGYYRGMGAWGERFRIVELDEWLEFMMDVE